MKKYSLLKCYPIAYDGDSDDNHFYIHVLAENMDYSLAVNMESDSNASRLHFAVREYELDALLSSLSLTEELPDGLYREDKGRMPAYLDYYEQPLFDFDTLTMANTRHPVTNPLLDTLKSLTEAAMAVPEVYILAYGALWGPKPNETDWVFRFRPGQGLHDIHCNQKSPEGSRFTAYDEPHKDGAIFYADPETGRAVGVFMVFRSSTCSECTHEIIDQAAEGAVHK